MEKLRATSAQHRPHIETLATTLSSTFSERALPYLLLLTRARNFQRSAPGGPDGARNAPGAIHAGQCRSRQTPLPHILIWARHVLPLALEYSRRHLDTDLSQCWSCRESIVHPRSQDLSMVCPLIKESRSSKIWWHVSPSLNAMSPRQCVSDYKYSTVQMIKHLGQRESGARQGMNKITMQTWNTQRGSSPYVHANTNRCPIISPTLEDLQQGCVKPQHCHYSGTMRPPKWPHSFRATEQLFMNG